MSRSRTVPALNRTIVLHEGGKLVKFPFKDPDEIDDYKLDWTSRLAPESDTVATSDWTIVTDMTGDANELVIVVKTNTDSSTTVWLADGTIGNTYILLNHITTTGGRTLEQSVAIKIKAR